MAETSLPLHEWREREIQRHLDNIQTLNDALAKLHNYYRIAQNERSKAIRDFDQYELDAPGKLKDPVVWRKVTTQANKPGRKRAKRADFDKAAARLQEVDEFLQEVNDRTKRLTSRKFYSLRALTRIDPERFRIKRKKPSRSRHNRTSS